LLPGVGHLRHREKAPRFVPVPDKNPKDVRDGKPVVRSTDETDGIARTDVSSGMIRK
jgi:hypothetical protein